MKKNPIRAAITALLVLVVLAATTSATTLDAELLADGWADRLDDPACGVADVFVCLPNDTGYRLGINGNSGWQGTHEYYCAYENGSILEYSLDGLLPDQLILSATLTLHTLRGYDIQPEIGVFPYAPNPAGAEWARADCVAANALDTTVPPAREEAFSLDVTAGVQAWLDAGAAQIGFLLCSLTDLSWNDTTGVLFTGRAADDLGYPTPTLVVEYDGVVANEGAAWGAVKALYR